LHPAALLWDARRLATTSPIVRQPGFPPRSANCGATKMATDTIDALKPRESGGRESCHNNAARQTLPSVVSVVCAANEIAPDRRQTAQPGA
jgi:hypothetical protein